MGALGQINIPQEFFFRFTGKPIKVIGTLVKKHELDHNFSDWYVYC